MRNKSERAYWWIDARANGLSKWIDSNRGRLVLIAIFAWLGVWGLLLEGRDDLDMARRFIRGMGPELAGIVIAAVTIDALAERRLEQERKAQLIRQMGSKYRDVTEMAIIELRNKGWLEDGSLIGAELTRANLYEANLMNANLSRVGLGLANLSGAGLTEANLSGAWLGRANLSGASLMNANLRGANLDFANLSGASLENANLSRVTLDITNLSGARLIGANLSGANFWALEQLEKVRGLEGAIMPDGVQLGRKGTKYRECIEGPTFDEWKAQYLSEHGGTVTDIRGFGD